MEFKRLTPSDADLREKMIFNRSYRSDKYRERGGCARFDHLNVSTAKKLVALEFVNPEDRQNYSPTVKEMIDFCDDGSGKWTLHGYVISAERDDCRVTFEGVETDQPLDAEEIIRFVNMFREADEFDISIDGARCWYD